MKILIVGAGNMGMTYIESFLHNQLLEQEQLYILEKSPEKQATLKQAGFKQVFIEPGEWIEALDILIIAVKPQDMSSVLPAMSTFVRANQVVLSIMAGVKMSTIAQHLPTSNIIRAMPNLPAQIGMGMTAYTATAEVARKDLFIVQNLLNTTGKTLYFEEETKLDAVTAISGSGPAYVFYFMQVMIENAQRMGFSISEAELLVSQTFMGAVHLEQQSALSCQNWIERVASRGGTTEAALAQFARSDVARGISQGLEDARKRAEELGS